MFVSQYKAEYNGTVLSGLAWQGQKIDRREMCVGRGWSWCLWWQVSVGHTLSLSRNYQCNQLRFSFSPHKNECSFSSTAEGGREREIDHMIHGQSGQSVGLYQDFKPCSCLWNFSCGNFVKCKCNENMTIIIMMIISVDRPQPLLRPMTHRWGPASAAGLGFYKYMTDSTRFLLIDY